MVADIWQDRHHRPSYLADAYVGRTRLSSWNKLDMGLSTAPPHRCRPISSAVDPLEAFTVMDGRQVERKCVVLPVFRHTPDNSWPTNKSIAPTRRLRQCRAMRVYDRQAPDAGAA